MKSEVVLRFITFSIFIFILSSVQYAHAQEVDTYEKEPAGKQQVVWHVKALHPDGYTLDVKAFDSEGNQFDVKALEGFDQRYIMDVKAFVGDEKLPVKVLVSEQEFKPVVAIGKNGEIYKIMAIDKSGRLLSIRGVRNSGYIIHIKAISENKVFYGVKAISEAGKLNDIKGIKMYDKRLELTMNGVEVHAHVVALPQVQ